MEKIKVNMSPNPLDVQAIHASQNDGEARQWEFELHNNGELIDTSEVTEQMVFKAYKGGTEQLLPENGSTPTTSPFKGDIRYPQGLLTNQEFTYRQSPTEEDGNAKIKNLYGNTLVWNQLVQNGNFVNTSLWGAVRGTTSASNNILSYSVTELGGGYLQNRVVQTLPSYAGHKYFISISIKAEKPFNLMVNATGEFWLKEGITPNVWNVCQAVRTSVADKPDFAFGCPSDIGDMAVGDVIQFKNVMLIDLTQMFGPGNEPSTIEEFTSLFGLSYYDFNQGSLLSFNGNGIKTVGKNLFDETKYQNIRSTYDYYDSGYYCRSIQLLPNTEYTISQRATTTSSVVLLLNKYSHVNESGFFDCRNAGGTKTYVTDSSGCLYIGIYANNSNAEANQRLSECQIQIEHGSTATAYEPYTESVINLPISTYFPTGMKSAGSVYDELTPKKAITRIGAVDMGTLNWTDIDLNVIQTNSLASLIKPSSVSSLLTPFHSAVEWSNLVSSTKAISVNANGIIRVKDTSYISSSAFKTDMSGVYLYYELATPTETSFTTASLVTENAEIPLSNEDGVLVGKCTEQLSAEPGFHDAKIKLSDGDGECYSNKLQLHVERSPQ